MSNLIKYFKNELFLQELVLFGMAQFLAVFVVQKIKQVFLEYQAPISEIGVSDFLIYFLIGTVVVFVFSHRSKVSNFAMFAFFVFTLFLGMNFFLSLFINPVSAFYFAVAVIIARFIFPSIFLHNVIFLFSIVAFSSALSLQFKPMTIIVILALLAVYDIVSVYWTKHMVKMAKAMIEKHLIFGFIIPEKIKYNFWGVEKAKPGLPAGRQGMGVVFLGGGDVGLPLFLVANVAATNIVQGLVVAVFAVLGMTLSYYLFVSQKLKKPMPALPPISMMCILGYFLIRVIWG